MSQTAVGEVGWSGPGADQRLDTQVAPWTAWLDRPGVIFRPPLYLIYVPTRYVHITDIHMLAGRLAGDLLARMLT